MNIRHAQAALAAWCAHSAQSRSVNHRTLRRCDEEIPWEDLAKSPDQGKIHCTRPPAPKRRRPLARGGFEEGLGELLI